jgi:hypothetical protein
MFWNIAGEFFNPKNMTSGSHSLYLVLKAALCSSPFLDMDVIVSVFDIEFCEDFHTTEICK